VKVWGPWFMENRKPLNIRTFLVFYNAAQVLLSTFIFVQVNCRSQKEFPNLKSSRKEKSSGDLAAQLLDPNFVPNPITFK
jgi:hypothetical protein